MNLFSRYYCRRFLIYLDHLQQVIFLGYRDTEYLEKRFYYEKKMQKARRKLFKAMKKIRYLFLEDHIERFVALYELIFSLNSLKYRIEDFSLFELCREDFAKIQSALSETLKEMRRKKNVNANIFLTKVDSLEEVYRGALQIVSRDPVIFLFFIENLRLLALALIALFESVFSRVEGSK